MATNPPDFLTSTEAAERAGVSDQCIREWCRKVPHLGVQVVSRWRIRPDVLSRVLAGGSPMHGVRHHVGDR